MIESNRRITYGVSWLVALMVVGMLWGCGVKGPPVPPEQIKPSAVTDLAVRLEEGEVLLSWTVPAADTKTESQFQGCRVYRSRFEIASYCADCPRTFEKVGDIDLRTDDPAFREPVASGYAYTYKVIVYTNKGMQSDDSNLAEIIVP